MYWRQQTRKGNDEKMISYTIKNKNNDIYYVNISTRKRKVIMIYHDDSIYQREKLVQITTIFSCSN
jgi:hypothetical protein